MSVRKIVKSAFIIGMRALMIGSEPLGIDRTVNYANEQNSMSNALDL